MVLLLLFLPVVTHGSPRSAMRDYNSGILPMRRRSSSGSRRRINRDMRLVFNAGDAAYRATNSMRH